MQLLTGLNEAAPPSMVTHSLRDAGFAKRTIQLLDGRLAKPWPPPNCSDRQRPAPCCVNTSPSFWRTLKRDPPSPPSTSAAGHRHHRLPVDLDLRAGRAELRRASCQGRRTTASRRTTCSATRTTTSASRRSHGAHPGAREYPESRAAPS